MAWAALGGSAVAAAGSIGAALLNKQQAPAQAAAVDPTKVQNAAISGDLSSLSSANQLASSVNSTNQSTALSNLNTALPGYSGLQQQLMSQYSANAANPYALPAGAQSQIMQAAAENNIGAGTGASSGFSGNNALRSLGVNIMQYGQQNLQNSLQALSTLTGTAPTVSPVSPLSFMLTPAQALSTATNNQQAQQASNNSQAAAANANSNNLFDALTSQMPAIGQMASTAIKAYNTPSDPQGHGGVMPY